MGGSDLFLNVAQIVLDEEGSGNPSTDQWLFGQQVGVKVAPIKDLQTTVAVAYYNAVNAQNNGLGQGVCNEGNSRQSSGTLCPGSTTRYTDLVNDYNVVDVTAHVATKVASLPVAVMGDYIQNTADTVDASGANTKDSGYQAGLILGKASDAKTWETAYFFKRVGTDATLADVADSDFGNGGTGRVGHIMWAAYNPTKALQVKVKYFLTEIEDAAASANDVNRLQADLSVKF
jgi:hypothetical protein